MNRPIFSMILAMGLLLTGCGRVPAETIPQEDAMKHTAAARIFPPVGRDTLVRDVVENPVFGDYGRLLFPVDRSIPADLTLEDVGDILIWYCEVWIPVEKK